MSEPTNRIVYVEQHSGVECTLDLNGVHYTRYLPPGEERAHLELYMHPYEDSDDVLTLHGTQATQANMIIKATAIGNLDDE